MSKKIWIVALIIIGIGLLIKGVMLIIGDPVEKDLMEYINDHVVVLSKTEAKILGSYAAVTGSNYKDDITLFLALKNTVVPKYSAFVDTLKSIKPVTKEVQVLHGKYLAGAQIELVALKMALLAVEKEDAQGVQDANNKLDSAKKIFAEFNTSMDSLAAEHDVKLIKNEQK